MKIKLNLKPKFDPNFKWVVYSTLSQRNSVQVFEYIIDILRETKPITHLDMITRI